MNDRNGLLPPTLCPERTFALVVGVEQYEIGPDWNLHGPSSDALRFAAWLTGPGKVPPDNVRLLLSPLASEGLDWSATPELTGLRAQWRTATEQHVKDALLKELARCDGDMLWIYWAGHGFVDQRNEMILVCSDAHEGEIRHLNLDSALRWWRTDRVRHPRFPLQAAIVDACRVPAPRNARPGTIEYGQGGSVRARRRQFQLLACGAGEAAKNDPERRAGQFTKVLLEELARRSPAECVTDLAVIGNTVHSRFEELRRTRRAWQVPQFIRDRDWEESSFLDDGLSVLPRAARLDQIAWDGLGEAFAEHALPRDTYDAYAWAFKVAGCTTPVHEGLPGDTLIDIAHDLDERQGGRPEIPLTLPFVRFLGHRAGTADPAWAACLGEWVEQTRSRLGVPPLPPPPPPSRGGTALHLQLAPSTEDEELYLARIWLRRGTTTAIWESEGRPLRLDEVRQALGRELRRVGTAADDESPYSESPDIERVEFHVPFELLQVPFEQWEMPGSRGKTLPLGVLHQVVVRCPQERADTRAAWKRKWGWLRTQGGKHPRAVQLVQNADVKPSLGVDLGIGRTPACVVADTTDPRTTDALDATLDGGVPVTVWWRDGTQAAGADGDELTALLEPNEDGTPTTNVLTLPGKVHALRRARAAASEAAGRVDSRLALLWDDPDCAMDTPSLHGSPATDPTRP